MNVLHLVAGGLKAGAARGAYWLHRELLEKGVDSTMLCNDRGPFEVGSVVSTAGTFKGRAAGFARRNLDRLPLQLYPGRRKDLFSCGLVGFDFRKSRAFTEADVVHLHWINAGFVNIRHVATVGKPLVWTMRDMWPFTGGCHYALDCIGYRSACGKCPHLGSSSESDLSRRLAQRKQRLLPRHIVAVGISEWLAEAARSSTALAGIDVRMIPNGVRTAEFPVQNKAEARAHLAVPADRNVIAAGAQHLSVAYKGGRLLLDALAHLDPDRYHLLLFGHGAAEIAGATALPCTSLGYVEDAEQLSRVYAAADVFVAASTMEAFGKTLVEAMSCETPVVCFDASGPREIVDHHLTGYKAIPFSSRDLADGIQWVIQNNRDGKLGRAARQKALSSFDSGLAADRYIALYEELAGTTRHAGHPS